MRRTTLNIKVWIAHIFVALLFAAAIGQLFKLQILEYGEYAKMSERQHEGIVILAPDRGDIFDRNGSLLVTTEDSYSVYLDPQDITSKEGTAKVLSEILGMPYARVLELAQADGQFVWIERKVPKWKMQKIEKANLAGVGFRVEKKRNYIKGDLASQVIGFAGIDNQGLYGTEFSCDKYLKGKEGKIKFERDVLGRRIATGSFKQLEQGTAGMNVTLTIDEGIQYVAERELAKAIKQFGAQKGTIIVMDVKSGDILAMAGKPDFDPNNYQAVSPSHWRNPAVSEVYEPGSTFKVITVAAGLEEKVIGPNSVFHIPDQIVYGGRVIKNSHPIWGPTRNMTVGKILEQSLNTGAAQIGFKLGPKRLMRIVRALGFGKPTKVGLMSEESGLVKNTDDFSRSDLPMITFGQSISVTPIQLATAYATLANNGIVVHPKIIKKVESPDHKMVKTFDDPGPPQRVISEKTCLDLKKLMEGVVMRGSGHFAKIAHFRVGGKTGTAQKVIPTGGYSKNQFIASFIGFAPLMDARIVTLVILDTPGVIWGEVVAAPTFQKVTQTALWRLNVVPDKL